MNVLIVVLRDKGEGEITETIIGINDLPYDLSVELKKYIKDNEIGLHYAGED